MKNLKIIALLSMVFYTMQACSDDDDHTSTDTEYATIVMVHGAWQNASVWDQVKNQLQSQGHTVVAVELLGHGEDETPVADITFEAYVKQVKTAIAAQGTPVILLGHSLGGAVITQTAAEVSEQIEKLVYIAGFIPENGKSVLDNSALDTTSLLPSALEFSADGSTAAIADPETNIPEIFCQYGAQAQVDLLIKNLKPEPLAPLATPLAYSGEDYNTISNKYYVFTKEDHAITYSFQKKMASDAGITKTYEVTSGHSPFVSRPDEVLQILQTILED
ncbi:alpha/beta fold hydrolase [Sinomicrobium pectinilyticum]|nr:alpha/beta hydrolase [Sinomicrobium pectinilyticum]